ncbi:MAG: carbamate kinase [Neisseriaceae bacterium]|nr:carbamate kinase [Neisseriaceae bacterium]
MKVVIALGGNALQKRGEVMSAQNQRANVVIACQQLAKVHGLGHQMVLAHGNGPQVGLLGLQNDAYSRYVDPKVTPYPLDVLGAETQGMIGYMLAQELANHLPADSHICNLLTQTVVAQDDPAFQNPTKFVGPVYNQAEAEQLAAEQGWQIKADGAYFRRVVASPLPQAINELAQIKLLIDNQVIVIAVGGGGIPVLKNQGQLTGVEAVIDKDLASGLLAHNIDAEYFIIATDVAAVMVNWGTPEQKAIRYAHPDALMAMDFASGSMGPKVAAACAFAKASGQTAVIGALEDITEMLAQGAGTLISTQFDGITYA